MADATVRLPGMLARFAGDEREVRVEAGTVEESLDRLVAAHPALEVHLFDGTGERRLRPHLLLFVDGEQVDPSGDGGSVELEEDSTVTVLQSVSGG